MSIFFCIGLIKDVKNTIHVYEVPADSYWVSFIVIFLKYHSKYSSKNFVKDNIIFSACNWSYIKVLLKLLLTWNTNK